MSIGIIVVDDHEVVRRGLKAILGNVPEIKWLGDATNSKEALQLLDRVHADVVVLDYKLGDVTGDRVCELIKSTHPDMKIIMLTAYCDEEIVTRCIKAGASGFVVKELGADQLIQAIITVSKDGMVLDKTAAAELVRKFHQLASLTGSKSGEDLGISARQLEVVKCVADGLSNEKIAERLCITCNTVQFHIQHVMEKLNCNNRAELIAKVMRLKLIE
jgi:two-component system, NarL family, response regulator DevR